MAPFQILLLACTFIQSSVAGRLRTVPHQGEPKPQAAHRDARAVHLNVNLRVKALKMALTRASLLNSTVLRKHAKATCKVGATKDTAEQRCEAIAASVKAKASKWRARKESREAKTVRLIGGRRLGGVKEPEGGFCCFYAPDANDKCGTCTARHDSHEHCGQSESTCLECNSAATFCAGGAALNETASNSESTTPDEAHSNEAHSNETDSSETPPTGNSGDCEQEYSNARQFSDDGLDHFCHRCRSEGGSSPLRCRCSYCQTECQAECTEGGAPPEQAPEATSNETQEEGSDNKEECEELIQDFREMHEEIRDCIASPTCFEAKEAHLESEIGVMTDVLAEMGCEEHVDCDMLEEEYEATSDALIVCVEMNQEHCSQENQAFLCESLEGLDYGINEQGCEGAGEKRPHKTICAGGGPRGGPPPGGR